MIFKALVSITTTIKYRLIGTLFISLLSFNMPAWAQNAPTVIELFTSRGCPACPPADRALNALAQSNPNILSLSCHVTYFNRQRKTDIFAAPFCDARQSVYKLALGTKQLYTPMMIVNGRAVTTGTTSDKIRQALSTAGSLQYSPVEIALNGQYLDIKLPRIGLSQEADIWLFEYLQSPNERGYSHYRNTVTKITKLMRWNGKAMNMAFPVNPGFDKGFAVIVQDFKSGIITAGNVEN